jgi:hypothetical protein
VLKVPGRWLDTGPGEADDLHLPAQVVTPSTPTIITGTTQAISSLARTGVLAIVAFGVMMRNAVA